MTETEMVQVRCLVQVVDGDGRHLPGEVISLPEPQLPALLEQGAVELADPDSDPSQEPGQEAGQEPSQEAGQEPSQEPGQEAGQEPSQEAGQEPSQEAGEEAGQEPGDTGTDTNETDANLPPKQPARGRSTKKKTRTRKKAGAAKRS